MQIIESGLLFLKPFPSSRARLGVQLWAVLSPEPIEVAGWTCPAVLQPSQLTALEVSPQGSGSLRAAALDHSGGGLQASEMHRG